MIGIVDYSMGNLGSVKRKLEKMNAFSIVSGTPKTLKACDKFILPGVGHFANAVKQLKTMGLWDFLQESVIIHRKPILGICLGMQLMTKHSEEGNAEGFGWFDAKVVKFNIKDTQNYKVPHIGWNSVMKKKHTLIFDNVDPDSEFYFVHSYHLNCNDSKDILNETVYEYPFVSAIQKDHIIGLQYHPEKSHDAGEQLLKNFIRV